MIILCLICGNALNHVFLSSIKIPFFKNGIKLKEQSSFNQEPTHRLSRKARNAIFGMKNLVHGLELAKISSRIGLRKYIGQDSFITLYPSDLLESDRNVGYLEIKEYRPDIFDTMRENAGVSKDQYLDHLLNENLHFLSNTMDSKSKQFFWKSIDHLLLIKTINHYEAGNLKQIISDLKDHVTYSGRNMTDPPQLNQMYKTSCLGNVLGLYRISVYSKFGYLVSKKYYMVTKNIFQEHSLINDLFYQKSKALKCSSLPNSNFDPFHSPERFPYLQYDLKGSFVGRKKSKSSFVYKDLDFLEHNQCFFLGEDQKQLLVDTLRYDSSFLARHNFMDYSLLVDIEKDSILKYHFSTSPLFPSMSLLKNER